MRYYMLNKPYGHVSACTDKEHPTVMDCFPEEDRHKLFPIGRLDIDTTGLLLITNDGWLSHCLTYPGFGVVKEYFFMAFGSISQEDIERIGRGTTLPGNGLKTAPAKIIIERTASVADVEPYLPTRIHDSALRNPKGTVTIGRVFVIEGRKHEVKLLIRSAGCHVFLLRRDSIGGVCLDPGLNQGEYRALTTEELQKLKRRV